MSNLIGKPIPPRGGAGEYSGLARLLAATTEATLTLGFGEIEAALGSSLPASARQHPAWWSNSERSRSHARAWLSVGWRTSQLSLAAERVTFVRASSVARPQSSSRSTPDTRSQGKGLGSHAPPAPQASRAPEDRKDRIGLVGCVKQKLGHVAPAADLYVSPLFRGRRACVERTCERWFILSALHGVVRPDAPLEPYDVTLNNASQAERRAWAATVLRQLDAELESFAGLTFEIHADANYADYGLVSGLRARGATVEQPVAGLNMGRQLAFYAGSGPAATADFAAASSGEAVTGVASADLPSVAPLTPAGIDAPSVAPQWQERDARTALADLDESPALVPVREWPAGITCLDRPGLYAWWVDEAGADDLSAGLGLTVESGRIYAGQAGATKWPSGKAGTNTLGKRIGQMHLGGKVRMSTFRWTLAALLFDQLSVPVQASLLTTPPSEQALTEWMRAHLSVAVHPHDDRDTLGGLEHEVLERLDPPLNLRHMPPTPVRTRLTELRRRISREVK